MGLDGSRLMSPDGTKTIFTIGYEGAKVADIIQALRWDWFDTAPAGSGYVPPIGRLVDVRAAPLSRKPGFSKKALSAALDEEGIGYWHIGELGNPKLGREAAKRGDTAEFHRIYKAHLQTPAAKAALKTLAAASINQGEGNGLCLLCFERDPDQCYRTLVADALLKMGVKQVIHLGFKAVGCRAGCRPSIRADWENQQHIMKVRKIPNPAWQGR